MIHAVVPNPYVLLQLQYECGYKVSKKKAQLCQKTVRYLGYIISQGIRTLGQERKMAILQIPEPSNRKQVRSFLGATGFCRIWIPNFSMIAKPL